jgi:hypothetical protein
MDDANAFIELSALLTGRYHLAADPEDRALYLPIAAEYVRRLRGSGLAGAAGVPALLDAYRSLVSTPPAPPIDDALLAKLMAMQEFKDHEFVARQIVNIVYFSQFKAADDPSAPFLDGGFHELGEVWPVIKTHPIGFSAQSYGYWKVAP